MDRHCPRCDSPDPKLHPAVQFEGEVELCNHSWHEPSADEIRARDEKRREQITKYSSEQKA